MKRKWLGLIYGTATLSLLAACSGSSESGSDPDQFASSDESTITVWAWDKNFNITIMERAGEYYTEDGHEDFKVDVVEMSNEDTIQKLVSGFTSGVSEGLPDIVLVEDYAAQNFLINYEGKFSELSEEIDFAQFAPYKVEAVTHDEGIYAVPFDSGSAGLYYRTDYLAEAGYTEEDMQNLTWSKFVDIGKDVKEKTGKWFVAFIPNRGTHYIQMAMQSAGVWYSATIKSAEDQSGKWAYTNLPLLGTVENATPYSNLGGSSWFVLEDSPNKNLAIEFLKTEFAGNDEFYQDILVENGAVGTYIPSQTGEAYQYKDPYFNDAQIYKDFSSWAEEIPGVDYGVNTSVAYEALRSVLQDYFDDKLTLDEMLEQAEEYYTMQIGE